VTGFDGPLFDYSAQPTTATPIAKTAEEDSDPTPYDPLDQSRKDRKTEFSVPDDQLEGFSDDPTITKVVDRRWFERNKHIFPASAWAEYGLDKDLSKVQRKDIEGNSFFFT
jgi:protein FAM50